MRLFILLIVTAVGLCVSSCAVPLGPGYTIEKQELGVHFVPAPEPRILIEADYQLRNTGNQPLSSLEMRLPGRRRFHVGVSQTLWDGIALVQETSPDNPRNTFMHFPRPWKVSARHTLHLSGEFQPTPAGESGFSFAPDAFFLPSEGWAPELLPSRGLFPTGGVPPNKWDLIVRVPEGFLLHTSGHEPKTSRRGSEITLRATQRAEDRYPFVIAGRYTESQLGGGKQRAYLWSRTRAEAASLQQAAESLTRTIQGYDATFGTRAKDAQQFWIVECPVVTGCFSGRRSLYANLLGEEGEPVSAELASLDTVMIDFSGGAPKLGAAAPSLAASWLGYGQNPGFFEQDPPLSALPAFAAALGHESVEGSSFRIATIRRALRVIPKTPESRKDEDAAVLRAKSFLFFYGLQDRCGQEAFRNALRHMLEARRGRGFEIADLIAAFGDETRQNVAEFVRLWMKHPGVPDEFRARYEDASTTNSASSKETTP